MKKLLAIILLLAIATAAYALGDERKWFYHPNGPLFAGKKAAASTPITYTLNCPFTSAAATNCANASIIGGASATCGDATACSTGSANVVATSTGNVSIAASNTVSMTGSSSLTTTGIVGSAITKTAGRTLFVTTNFVTGLIDHMGFNTSAALSSTNPYYFQFNNGLFNANLVGTGNQTVGAVVNGNTYKTALVLGGYDSNGIPSNTGLYGASYYIQGGAYTNWTRVGSNRTGNTATLYFILSQYSATAGVYDNIKITNSPSVAGTIFQPNNLDTFTGTTGDLLTTHTPDVGGGTWTKRVTDSTIQIDTNAVEWTGAGTDPLILPVAARYVYLTTVANGMFNLTVRCDSTNGAENGLWFRGKADGATGMNGWAYRLVGDGTNCDEYVTLFNNDGGTNKYANAAGTLVNGTTYNLTIQAIGNTIRLYRDNTKISTDITDATHNDGTRAGIYASTVSLTDKAFDNFFVFPSTTSGTGATFDSYFSGFGY